MTNIETLIQKAQTILKSSRYTVALTGAGISTPSGIPDFRSADSGVWETHDPMEVASITAFRRRPQQFYSWMRPLTSMILNAVPNPAHLALRDLEQHGPLRSVITQNIDNLHTRAGSQTVREVHGHLREAVCLGCAQESPSTKLLADFADTGEMPTCSACGSVLKPKVILFGEALPYEAMAKAELDMVRCDVMIVVGSSLTVAPVGDMPMQAYYNGARLIVINYTPTHVDAIADVVIRGDVAAVLPQIAAAFVK
ncbi:MAG: NAD-dependent deacylase [Anaerolineales bacterium]|nr:NAD-dependent deacylase [Anaerolineales bacterium]